MTTKFQQWPELNILRGLAAVFMIINHGGYKLLLPDLIKQNEGIAALLFITSFAPVLFFFVTGVGYGLQHSRPNNPKYWHHTLYKVLILLIADQFLNWSEGRIIGLDFLGFIGISSLVLAFIRISKYPTTFSFIGFIVVTLLRFAIGPVFHKYGYDQGLVAWILGTTAIEGIAYPLSPWLAYPLLGYCVGFLVSQYYDYLQGKRSLILTGLTIFSVLPSIATLVLWKAGASFHRWGTMNIGFYTASFTVILLTLALSMLSAHNPLFNWKKVQFISLRGVSSLAVVPLHYLFINFCRLLGLNDLDNLSLFIPILLLLIGLSIYSSKSVENIIKVHHDFFNLSPVKIALIGFLILSALLTIHDEKNFASYSAEASGQLILCIFLTFSK